MRIKQIGFELKAGKQACKIGGGASQGLDTPPISGFSLWSVDLCRPLTHLQLFKLFTLYTFTIVFVHFVECGFMQTTDTPSTF